MIDPANGNYQLENNSPALGYGCQTFVSRKSAIIPQNYSKKIDQSAKLKRETVQGVLSGTHTWSADSVMVTGNLKIDSSATLNILPGTKVVFTGNYKLEVKGRLNACGTALQRIEFKHQNHAQFTPDTLIANCWSGIEFYNSSSVPDSSKLEYCSLENVKYLPSDSTIAEYAKFGGAVRLFNFSKLQISNSIFKNNVATYGTAISCFYQSNPQIVSNLITQNKAKINAPAIFCAHSYPRIINNTITDNQIIVQIPFAETAAIYNFIAKPLFINNIVWNNQTFADQIKEFKDFYTYNNDIANLENSSVNLSTDPLFADSLFYKLSENSPCRNAGTKQVKDVSWPLFDLTGIDRMQENSIDIGANEYTTLSINQPQTPQISALGNYPNPFNNTTILNFTLNKPGNISVSVLNLRGEELFLLRNFYPTGGKKELTISGKELASGIYFCRINGENIQLNHRILLLK